ncbi:MAG TPA: tetratricopeptide repeat protein [Magnetospirillum sp.]|nr:tetratricopeptide repeat protein [Magnetospirillum sp.]
MRDLRPVLCSLAVTLALAACSSAPPPTPVAVAPKITPVPPEMLRMAEMALEDGQPNEARQRFTRLAGMDPQNPWVRLGLAESLLATDDAAHAREWFDELQTVEAVRARALQGKGLALMRQNRLEDAATVLTAATEADPTLWRAWNALGGLHDIAKKFDLSAQAYERALALRPESGVIRNNMGYSLLLQGKPAEAARVLMDAIQHEPRLEAAHANLRLALALQGRYQDARAGLTKDRQPAALNNIGFVALSRGDLNEAEAFLVQAIEASPSYHDRAAANLLRARALKGG